MKLSNDWKQFLIGALGTAVGVGLTFFISGIQQKHQQERNRRLTAIMVIHDIDNTIEMVKGMKKDEEEQNELMQKVLKHGYKLDNVPYDTITSIVNVLVSGDRDFHFDTSKEKIFNSDLDTWQNLGSMTFLDNVQNFFLMRQSLESMLNSPNYCRAPIPMEEYMQVLRKAGWVSEAEYADMVGAFFRKKLKEDQVRYYIDCSSYRVNLFNYYIDSWTRANNQNKFVMGITDKEMEDYINSITNEGIAPTPALLAGTWRYDKEDDNYYIYHFERDSVCRFDMNHSRYFRMKDWHGRLKYSASFPGSWKLQADSLILNVDYSEPEVNMDVSGIVLLGGVKDSLDSWAERYKKYLVDYYKKFAGTPDARLAAKARLDPSRDKMEWTNSVGPIYVKRQK